MVFVGAVVKECGEGGHMRSIKAGHSDSKGFHERNPKRAEEDRPFKNELLF